MICRDVMTKSPACCVPGDSASKAAQLMRQQDVGPIPIVDASERLIGIVTDRDLAIKVVADGKDSRTTTVSEIMTRNVVACHEEDNLQDALSTMAGYQIRRLPVIDHNGHLCGIISQADLAQCDPRMTGIMVQKISTPHIH